MKAKGIIVKLKEKANKAKEKADSKLHSSHGINRSSLGSDGKSPHRKVEDIRKLVSNIRL